MSIVASDIVAYGSTTMPDDDSATGIGGAIDTTKRVVFTDIDATGPVEILSSSGADNYQTVTVYGRNAGGTIISDGKVLNGVTPVDISGNFERILKVVMTAIAAGTVTVRKDGGAGDLVTMEPGVKEVRRPFYNASSDIAGGSARDYYEKIFIKNTHGTLDLTNAEIAEQADPSTYVTFDLEATLDGSDTNGAGNRQTHSGDGGTYTFDSTAKDVANSKSLTSGSAQGVWLKLSLAAGEPADNTSWTARISGATT